MTLKAEAAIAPNADTLADIGRDCSLLIFPQIDKAPRFASRARSDKKKIDDVLLAQIVPRLKTLHHGLASGERRLLNDKDIVDFAELAMGADGAASAACFENMRASGFTIDQLFLDLLTPVARHLGKLWEEDHCDFFDVTLGLARLQNLLCVFGGETVEAKDNRMRALLITTQGEGHSFGLEMLASFMRGAGWEVCVQHGLPLEQNVNAASREWFGVVGVALSFDKGLRAVAQTLDALRRASANKSIRAMVGGPVFSKHPRLAARVGADATAADALSATLLAKKLLLAAASEQRPRAARPSRANY